MPERVKLGLKRSLAEGKQLGRPQVDEKFEAAAKLELRKGTGILKTAKLLGLGTGTVQRIKREMGGADMSAG